jgi:hypothetical protein
VRYWIKDEDEDYDREFARASAAGGALPANISPGTVTAMAVMIAAQVTALAATAFLVFDWLRK